MPYSLCRCVKFCSLLLLFFVGCVAQPEVHYTVTPSPDNPRQARLGGMVTDQIIAIWEQSDRDAAVTLETLRTITADTPIVVNDEWPTNKTPTEYWSDAIQASKRFSFNAAARAVSLRPADRSLRIVLAGPKQNRRVAYWSWYVRDFEGNSLRYQDETPVGFANILDYGVTENDETDQAGNIVAAFQGDDHPTRWYFPPGEYEIDTPAWILVSQDTEVRCHADAVFRLTVDADAFRFIAIAGARGDDTSPDFTWIGGTFDGSNQPVSLVVPWAEVYPALIPGESRVVGSLSFQNRYEGRNDGQFGHITVREVTMDSHPEHWQLAGGDQSLFIHSCNSALIEDCVFRSARDLGIYLSDNDRSLEGSSTTDMVIRNCRFENCMGGIAIKRGGIGITVDNCEFENCVRGFISQNPDETLHGGTNIVVKNSTFDRCWEAVLLERSLGCIVENNTFTEMGHEFPGGAIPDRAPFIRGNGTVRDAIALRSNGCAYVAFRDNIVSGKAATWLDRPVIGVYAFEDDGIPNTILGVSDNVFEDIDLLAWEGLDAATFTVVRNNTLIGAVAPFVPRNEGSTYEP